MSACLLIFSPSKFFSPSLTFITLNLSPEVKHHTHGCIAAFVSLDTFYPQHQFSVMCLILSLHALPLSCSHFHQTPTFHLPPQKLPDLVCARQHLCNIKTASVFLLLNPILSEGKRCPGLSALTSLGTFHSYHFMLPAHQGFTTGTVCRAIV